LLLGESGENDLKMAKMNLEENLRKEIQKKIGKGKGGASRPRPRFWPAGRSRPGPPALSPSPSSRSRPRPRARTASPRRRGAPAGLGRRVAGMRQRGRARSATRSPWTRPPKPPLPFAPSTARSCPLLALAQRSPLRRTP